MTRSLSRLALAPTLTANGQGTRVRSLRRGLAGAAVGVIW